MRRIRFGRTNVEVPVVSLGTWGHGGARTNEGNSVGWSGHDDTKAKEALALAWRDGITHWDTADAYGDGQAEELIGEVLASDVPRGEIFLASKFGWIKGPSGRWYDPKFMREQCERSLRNMRTDVIDLYYFHHCMFGERDEYFDDALAMMHTLRDEGKIRFIGLSDWDSSRIMKFIERVDPDVVQPYRNLVDDEYDSSGLKAYVDAHDLGVAFFSPLKHGLLLGKYTEPQTFPEGDFRRGVADFRDPEAIARYRHASEEVRRRFNDREEPVLSAVVGSLLTGNPTATVLLGQRNARQTEAAAKIGAALSETDAAWVRSLYRAR
ncbi:MAG TPA: aldo/keto reductase [Thermoanaerobaculia bacterium]|jgi:aryl-alcohol dehydrogenase-like predicted oxidoreductase